ncbi:MAG: glycosyltransferase family 39 protein [Acidobacteria bacterium]|nr:glycosyltransferase family 39 protein [Acidobacteriota bacterium]
MHRPVLTLVLLSTLTFFFGLGRQAITDSDEAFYAESSREMVEGGDWITPHFNYQDRWQKPILYYWLTAATYLATGATEAAARWWSALSGLGLVLLTWAAARRLARQDADAWLAGAMAATCYGYFAMARLALPDLPLAFLVTLTIWTALEERWLLAGAAAGLGFLTKGPVALVVPAVVLVPIWWREHRRLPIPPRALATALVVFALIGLPWYGAMTALHGVEYLQSFFVADNFERFATDRFNEPRPFWFYLPIVVGGMLPWSVFLVLVPLGSAVAVLRRRRRLTTEEWRLLLWAAMPLLFFTISIGKQPRYILPVLPPVAILLGRSIMRRVRETDPRGRRALAAATWGTAALVAVLAVLLVRARPLFVTAHPPLTSAGVVAIGATAVAFVWVALSRQWSRLPAVASICAAVVLLSVQFGALAGMRPEPVEQMAALVATHRMSGEPVGTYQVFVRNLVFYTRFKQVDLFDEGLALDFLKSPGRVLLVVRAVDLPRLELLSGIKANRLAEVRYLNTTNVRPRTLISPIPEQDVETVLLVANRQARFSR